jgi:hypothetical protein
MKKRIALALALSLLAAALSMAAIPEVSGTGNNGEADVVVLLDSSQSVLPYFQDVTDFVLSSVVKDFLRFGDTFHLLTFGDSAQAEIAQKMNDERDVKSVLGRLYLLYPLSRHSDFLGALSYLHQYLSDLPVSRRKIVVVITDGVQNSPPESRSATMDKAQISSEIEKECQAIRANGWDLRLIKLPLVPKDAAGAGANAAGSVASAAQTDGAGESYIDVAAAALGARVSEFDSGTKESLARTSLALPTVEYPANLGKRGYDFSFPLKVSNGSDSEVDLELESIALGPDEVLAKKSFLKLSAGRSGVMDLSVALPDSLKPGPQALVVEPRFANGVRVSPPTGTIAFTLAPLPFGAFFRSGLRVVLFALLLAIGLAAVLIVVTVLRRVGKRTEAPIVDAVLDAAAQDQRATASGSTAAKPAVAQRPATAASARAEPSSARPEPAKASQAAAPSASTASTPGTTVAPADRAPAGQSALPPRAARAVKPASDEHELAIAKETEELAKAAKSDSSRAASVLAEAAQAGSASAFDKIAAFKERMEKERAAAAKKKQATAGAPAAASPALAGGAPAPSAPGRGAAPILRPGTIRVEMKVEDQNPNIGLRNVCTIHAGQSKTVGGGRSDFLAFLVPVARNAADLRFDGERLTLVPRKPELFPGADGPIEDCLGQDILMLGKNGYPLILRFVVYERPADKINRLLHCIETPGLVHDLDA